MLVAQFYHFIFQGKNRIDLFVVVVDLFICLSVVAVQWLCDSAAIEQVADK